jgi:dTDP-4-amino-4,6-dideoxygalactose transaminase
MSLANPTRNVPFFNYRGAFAKDREQFIGIMTDVLDRGAFIMQQDVRDFEKNLAKYLGVKHAFGLANGTDAIQIGLMAAGLEQGDEVLFPSHTMVATPSAIAMAGGVPVPVEMGPDHMMDHTDLERHITSKTKAICPVQVNGRTCDMDAIQSVCDKHGLFIVEDAAQGLGSKFKGRFAGTFGAAGTFSFYPAKVLGCFGDGGGLVTNDDAVADKVTMLRDHGRREDGEIRTWGFNSRLDNMQAAILNYQLKTYDTIVNRRRAIAKQYQALLGDLENVVLPPGPDSDPDHFDRRDELQAHLREKGIGTLIQWSGKAVHQWPGLGFNVSLPKTEKFFERCIMIPMNMTMEDADVEYVAETIRAFYK